MSTTEPTTTESTARSATAIAWLVTLLVAAGLVSIVVLFAFSNNNTPASVDGTTATTSQWVDHTPE